jgi:hypothetical protein
MTENATQIPNKFKQQLTLDLSFLEIKKAILLPPVLLPAMNLC